jgi:ABC-2 type transport system permease protein
VLLMAVTGAATGIAHGLHTGDVGHQVARLVAAALVPLPAVWVVSGLALALWGLAPALAGVSWFVVVAVVLIGELGPLLQLPRWVLDLSPFAHLPPVPGAEVPGWSLLWLAVVAAGLLALGLVGLRRRDMG